MTALPEAIARGTIDRLLIQAGRHACDANAENNLATAGVAIRGLHPWKIPQVRGSQLSLQ